MEAFEAWLGQEQFLELKGALVDWGIRMAAAIVLLLIGLWAVKLAAGLVKRAMQRAGQETVLVDFVRNVVHGALLVLLMVMVLQQLGVPSTSLVAAVGAAGLAIGLSLRDSLANLAAGVLLITFRPFKGGDYVEIAGQGGRVECVRMFFTLLATPDNREITLPNNQITTNPIINYTARDTRRVDMEVGIAYESDIAKAFEVVRKVFESDERVLKDPEPFLMVSTLADSSVNLAVRPWVRTEDYWSVRSDLLSKIKGELSAAGIDIPFPQRTVRIVGGSGGDAETRAAAGAA